MLRCPNCGASLKQVGKSYQCDKGHMFDIAKQGYTNLLIHTQKSTGDNKIMVDARKLFFSEDYYHALKESIINLVNELEIKTLIDAGCGEGYYTNAIKEKTKAEVYGFDMSKLALAKAAKGNHDVHYYVASVFDMPIENACADGVLSIFAPYSFKEMARVLKDYGYFIKVGPGPYHLFDLKEVLYEEPYLNKIEEVSDEAFELVKHLEVEDEIEVIGQDKIDALFKMTPYYYHTPKERSMRLNELGVLKTRLQFNIDIYRKK